MKAICHIGHHKTGTTTLQAFLSQNSDRLLRGGTLYPWVETEGASRALAKAIDGGDQGEILSLNIREAHNALAFRMLADTLPAWQVPSYHENLPHSRQMLLAISNQIAALRPDLIVLCSEVMSNFGKIAADQIPRLRNEALAAAEHFTLWCTLRRPDEQLVSWHGQQIRLGQAPAPLCDPEHGLNLNWLHVDYRGVIEPWLKQIPETELILRPYREALAAGGSVDDFMRGAAIGKTADLLPVPLLNIGQKPAVVSLLRLGNAQLPEPLALQLADLIGPLTKDMALAATSEVEFLGADARARLVAHFGPIHDWLSQVSGRARFFTDIDDMAVCRPIPENEALQSLLDQLAPGRIKMIEPVEIRDFLTRLRTHGATIQPQ